MKKQLKIGILGGNEKALFFLEKGHKYENKCVFEFFIYDKNVNCQVKKFYKHNFKFVQGNFNNKITLEKFLNNVDICLPFTRKINVDVLKKIKNIDEKLFSSLLPYKILKNRLSEKKFYQYLNLPHAKYLLIKDKNDLYEKSRFFEYPIVIKPIKFKIRPINYIFIKNKDSKSAFLKAEVLVKKHPCIAENYKNWIGQFSLIGVRTKSKENIIVSYNWNIYYSNVLFITQPNYVRKKLLFDSKQIFNKILDNLDCPGIYTIKFFELRKLKLVVNSIIPYIHNSGNHAIYNLTYDQYDALFKIILEDDNFKVNIKIENYAFLQVIGKKYRKFINELVSNERLIKVIDHAAHFKTWDEEHATIITKRNKKNHDLLATMIRKLHDFKPFDK